MATRTYRFEDKELQECLTCNDNDAIQNLGQKALNIITWRKTAYKIGLAVTIRLEDESQYKETINVTSDVMHKIQEQDVVHFLIFYEKSKEFFYAGWINLAEIDLKIGMDLKVNTREPKLEDVLKKKKRLPVVVTTAETKDHAFDLVRKLKIAYIIPPVDVYELPYDICNQLLILRDQLLGKLRPYQTRKTEIDYKEQKVVEASNGSWLPEVNVESDQFKANSELLTTFVKSLISLVKKFLEEATTELKNKYTLDEWVIKFDEVSYWMFVAFCLRQSVGYNPNEKYLKEKDLIILKMKILEFIQRASFPSKIELRKSIETEIFKRHYEELRIKLGSSFEVIKSNTITSPYIRDQLTLTHGVMPEEFYMISFTNALHLVAKRKVCLIKGKVPVDIIEFFCEFLWVFLYMERIDNKKYQAEVQKKVQQNDGLKLIASDGMKMSTSDQFYEGKKRKEAFEVVDIEDSISEKAPLCMRVIAEKMIRTNGDIKNNERLLLTGYFADLNIPDQEVTEYIKKRIGPQGWKDHWSTGTARRQKQPIGRPYQTAQCSSLILWTPKSNGDKAGCPFSPQNQSDYELRAMLRRYKIPDEKIEQLIQERNRWPITACENFGNMNKQSGRTVVWPMDYIKFKNGISARNFSSKRTNH